MIPAAAAAAAAAPYLSTGVEGVAQQHVQGYQRNVLHCNHILVLFKAHNFAGYCALYCPLKVLCQSVELLLLLLPRASASTACRV
jgi:hypothetical protein